MADREGKIRGLRVARGLVWFIWAIIVAAEIILGIAFFLLLFGANPAASFAQWIYRAANNIMEPFRGIFGTIEADHNDSVLDLSILFAMFMYGILAMLVDGGVSWLDNKIRKLKAQQFYEDSAAQQAAANQAQLDAIRAAQAQTLGAPAQAAPVSTQPAGTVQTQPQPAAQPQPATPPAQPTRPGGAAQPGVPPEDPGTGVDA